MTLPVITALEPDPRRPGTLRVEVDGVRFGAVPQELARAAGLTGSVSAGEREFETGQDGFEFLVAVAG